MNGSIQNPMLSKAGALVKHIKSQQIDRDEAKKSHPTFYRNLEEALDVRRGTQSLFSIVQSNWQTKNAVDFCSNDYLSWNTTGLIRTHFLDELSRYPDFSVAAGGSRVMEGNYPYIEETEAEIAAAHGAEAGLITSSAFDANVMVWTALPRPGDVIVYDALVHASTHEGMERSLAIRKTEFLHNDVDSFRETLLAIIDSQPLIKQGKRSIIVAVESIYSMEGDVCPLLDLVEIAEEVSHGHGNIQFVVDETHSTGLIGPKGYGLVCELGLEAEIAGQESIQILARTFFEALTSHPLWPSAQEKGLLSVPLAAGWEERPYLTHIVTVWPRQKYIYWLYLHLLSCSFFVLPVKQPIVPVGESRLRITFHAENTPAQVTALVEQIFTWMEEVMDIEQGKTQKKVTRAAGEVYVWMKQEGLRGFGMV
ncbi:hypothetical protein EKO27_g7408 [Xylaria grammica]|uniref:Aminotransferase class I/classII large domain-containing protein n=1 Tax=Xylaria grammica TaxID=363999 RepID=A0A439CZX4_9PEZI|nr:hypothetical protein EKO27_g7408 [Xylaria grammica]